MRILRQGRARLAVALLLTLTASAALAQDAEPAGTEWSSDAIMALVAAIFAGAATMYARWKAIPPGLPLPTKLARMFDLSQVVDSTRRLDDPEPSQDGQ